MIQNPLEPPPLSPDLEWMLQSEQVSDQTVAEVIARDHFSPIYSLVRVYLKDLDLASAVVFETISRAVSNRHNYWGDVPVRAWLLGFAYRICQEHGFQVFLHRFSRLVQRSEFQPTGGSAESQDGDIRETLQACRSMPKLEIISLLLQSSNCLDNRSIGRVMGLREARVEKLLRRAHHKAGNPHPEILEKALAEYEANLSMNGQQVQEVVAGVKNGTRRHSRFSQVVLSMRGLMVIATVVILVLALTWYASGSLFGNHPTPIRPPLRTLIVYVTATPDLRSIHSTFQSTAAWPFVNPNQNATPTFEHGSNSASNIFYDPAQDTLPKKSSLDFDPILRYYQVLASSLSKNNTGPASLGMVLRYLGWKGTVMTVISDLMPNAQDNNVMPQEMVDYIQSKTDYRALLRFGGSIDLLQRLVAGGFPVIIQRGASDGEYEGWYGRYEVIGGYDRTTSNYQFSLISLRMGEPSEQSLPYSQLTADWMAFNHAYLIVYSPDQEKTLMNILGSDFEAVANYRNVYENSYQEELSYSSNPRQHFFSLFNRGVILTYLDDYRGAAEAFDRAQAIYLTISEPEQPWRIYWYQTRSYWAYYYTGQYERVITLANENLAYAGDLLAESYYWRALAEEALGDIDQALNDLQIAISLNPNFSAGIYQLNRIQNGG